jgi:ankyrin repeat protein
VASHLESFKDLNALVRTSRFFHAMFNPHLYRLAVAANDAVLNKTVVWVLSRYRLASLTLLLDHGLSVNYSGWFGGGLRKGTMLGYLCRLVDQERSAQLARLLIERGADIEDDANDPSTSETVLYKAIWHHNFPIAALLLAHGADCNAICKSGDTLLHCAIRGRAGNDARMVNLLAEHGAAIDGRSKWYGDTPLIFSIRQRHYGNILVLLAHGPDGGAPNNTGMTPLHYASCWFESEHHEVAKYLLEHGAVVNATDERGQTPLHCLLAYHLGDCLFMARLLLDNGADVNAVSNDGLSPLQLAVAHRQSREVIPLLLKRPMQLAVAHRQSREVIRLLLKHGADVTVLNREERRRLSRILA